MSSKRESIEVFRDILEAVRSKPRRDTNFSSLGCKITSIILRANLGGTAYNFLFALIKAGLIKQEQDKTYSITTKGIQVLQKWNESLKILGELKAYLSLRELTA